MIVVRDEVTLAAPLEVVQRHLSDLQWMTKLTPGIVIDEVVELPGGLRRVRWHSSNRQGSTTYGQSEQIETTPDGRSVTVSSVSPFGSGQLDSRHIRQLTAVPQGTRLQVRVEFHVSPTSNRIVFELFRRERLRIGVVYTNTAIRRAFQKKAQSG